MCPRCGRILSSQKNAEFECGKCGFRGLPRFVDEKTAIEYPMKEMNRGFVKRIVASFILIVFMSVALGFLINVLSISYLVSILLVGTACVIIISLDRSEEYFFHSRWVLLTYQSSQENAEIQEKFRKEDIERQKRTK